MDTGSAADRHDAKRRQLLRPETQRHRRRGSATVGQRAQDRVSIARQASSCVPPNRLAAMLKSFVCPFALHRSLPNSIRAERNPNGQLECQSFPASSAAGAHRRRSIQTRNSGHGAKAASELGRCCCTIIHSNNSRRRKAARGHEAEPPRNTTRDDLTLAGRPCCFLQFRHERVGALDSIINLSVWRQFKCLTDRFESLHARDRVMAMTRDRSMAYAWSALAELCCVPAVAGFTRRCVL